MQLRFQESAGDVSALKDQRLAARQARLGILANGAEVALPILPPRDVWTRWPKLRSSRRKTQTESPSPCDELEQDRVLNGDMLDAYMRDMRSSLQCCELPQAASQGAVSDGRDATSPAFHNLNRAGPSKPLRLWAVGSLVAIVLGVIWWQMT